MSKQPTPSDSDSFLPSGAMESPREFGWSRTQANVPRSMPEYIPSPPNDDNPKPFAPIPHANGSPMSPPKTRSGSADSNSATLIDNWRAYAQKLDVQFKGERAHILADRERREEVIEEERALWEEERLMWKDENEALQSENNRLRSELAQAQADLARYRSQAASQASTGANSRILSRTTSQRRVQTKSQPVSAATASPGSIDGTPGKAVPQETGRNADGTAYYAPAPVNPSRTFAVSESGFPEDNLRLTTVASPREDPIRVTSKELKATDFGVQSPPQNVAHVTNIPAESIDISLIQPELDGVPIKASAVEPSFAMKVLSPSSFMSPTHLSPNINAPARPDESSGLSQGNHQSKKTSALEVMKAPENLRLTMHAGHTPNHSVTNFQTLFAESGNATPTQANHIRNPCLASDGACDDVEEPELEQLDEDPALTGKLGLSAQRLPEDDVFLTQLMEKLEEAKRSEGVSPSSESECSLSEATQHRDRDSLGLKLFSLLNRETGQSSQSSQDHLSNASDQEEDDDEIDGGPILKLRKATNFGKPMGTR